MRPIPLIVTLTLILSSFDCQIAFAQENLFVEALTQERSEIIDEKLKSIIKKHSVNTAGVGIIKNGSLIWTGYYGEQSPGIAASASTLFDVASITKTVAAETILRLVAQKKLSLDESMSSYWIDPDVSKDPRHKKLTPRMAISHSTGFLNWRFFSNDGILSFVNEPGSQYGYSGEGYEYVMRYAENKLNRDFESLVREVIFDPIGMKNASYSVRKKNFARIARPRDSNNRFYGYYCRPNGWCRSEGDYSAADDMVITVEDYAKFMISSMNGEGLNKRLIAERNRVQVSNELHKESRVANCSQRKIVLCPDTQGYGLGWAVLDYGNNQLIGHGGSDWSEVAQAYFYTSSKDGIIIFLNAPNLLALAAMSETIGLIDPGSPMSNYYKRWYSEALIESK